MATRGRPARFDLDGGSITWTEGTRLFPEFVSGPWLIVGDANGEKLAKLPLDDLGADPELLLGVDGAVYAFIASPIETVRQSGEMWLAVHADMANPLPMLYLVDIDTGEILDQRLADDEAWRLASARAGGLVTAPSGGVFQSAGDTYERVADGRLVTSDAQRALVQTCDQPFACVLNWLDTKTWEPLDLIAPADTGGYHVFIHDTDWIFTPTADTVREQDSGDLLNVITGEVINVDLPVSTGQATTQLLPALSPDGRLLATHDADGQALQLRDLRSGDTVLITLDEHVDGPLIFIPDAP